MIDTLNNSEKHIYSQQGEDGVIATIIDEIGINEGFFVEVGVQNGRECNCRNLIDKNWYGLMFDCDDRYFNPVIHRYKNSFLNVQNKLITPENILTILRNDYKVDNIDLFSLDIDSNDYYVIKELIYGNNNSLIKPYKPKVLVLEYNSQLGPNDSISVKYDPDFKWDWTYYQGCSLMALVNLLKNDYSLVYCEHNGINCFFIRNDLMNNHFVKHEPKELFKPCNFACGPKWGNPEGVCGHPKMIKKENGAWVTV